MAKEIGRIYVRNGIATARILDARGLPTGSIVQAQPDKDKLTIWSRTRIAPRTYDVVYSSQHPVNIHVPEGSQVYSSSNPVQASSRFAGKALREGAEELKKLHPTWVQDH